MWIKTAVSWQNCHVVLIFQTNFVLACCGCHGFHGHKRRATSKGSPHIPLEYFLRTRKRFDGSLESSCFQGEVKFVGKKNLDNVKFDDAL